MFTKVSKFHISEIKCAKKNSFSKIYDTKYDTKIRPRITPGGLFLYEVLDLAAQGFGKFHESVNSRCENVSLAVFKFGNVGLLHARKFG